jgi:hypothetical protein
MQVADIGRAVFYAYLVLTGKRQIGFPASGLLGVVGFVRTG